MFLLVPRRLVRFCWKTDSFQNQFFSLVQGGFCFAPLDSFQLMIARLSYPLILLLCLLVVFSLQRLAVALSRCCCKQRSANTIELLDDNDDDENDQHWNPDYDEEISQPDVDSDAPLSAAESEVPEVYQESSASTRSSLSSFARSKLSIIWTQSSQSDSFFAWHRFARTALAIALLTFSVLLQVAFVRDERNVRSHVCSRLL